MESANEKIWQSHVWHKGKAFFVSTIFRTYETYAGESRGFETLVWIWDEQTQKRGDMIGHMGGLDHHQSICRCLIATGEMLDEHNDDHARFMRAVK